MGVDTIIDSPPSLPPSLPPWLPGIGIVIEMPPFSRGDRGEAGREEEEEEEEGEVVAGGGEEAQAGILDGE